MLVKDLRPCLAEASCAQTLDGAGAQMAQTSSPCKAFQLHEVRG